MRQCNGCRLVRHVGELWLDWFAGVPAGRAASHGMGLCRGFCCPRLSRKNCWWLAQTAGYATPGRMQHLLARARWDADRLRGRLLGVIAARIAVPDGVLIVDETGFAKKGTASVAVARQYSGTLGRIDNCQIGVFLTYATSRLRLLADRVLYLPKAWTDDPAAAPPPGFPTDIAFATRAALALVMIARAVAAGITARGSPPMRPTAGTTSSGPGSAPWAWTMSSRSPATSTSPSPTPATGSMSPPRPCRHRPGRPTPAGRAPKARAGTSGPGSPSKPPTGPCQSVLIRRCGNGTLAYYLTCAQTRQSLALSDRRRRPQVGSVEETFQISKDAFGLDEYQTRSWDGWQKAIPNESLPPSFPT